MAIKTKETYINHADAVQVEVGQHFSIDGHGKGYAVKLGRKYVEVLIYGGRRVKVDPLKTKPLETHHN